MVDLVLPPLPPKPDSQGIVLPPLPPLPRASEQTMSYDPMGMPTGMTETVPAPSAMPYSEQMRKLGDVGRGAAYGVPAAVIGLPGDIESLGRAGINLAAGGMGYKAPVSPESKLPTTERVGSAISKTINPIFGFKGGKEEELGKIFGETAGSFIGPEALVKGAGKLAETAIGRASLRGAKVAEKAEKEGFRVSAPQVKSKDPVGVPMSPKEQLKMNEKVTAETGKPTKDVSAEYVKERLTDLGKEYDKIYNRTFQIDESIAKAAKDILSQERDIAAAGDSGVASIANNISNRFEKAKAEALEKQMMQIMSGQKSALKRGGGQTVSKTFGPGERVDAAPLTQELLKQYGAANHTNVRPITAADAPVWAKEVNSLITELTDKLGMRVRPGVYVGNGSGSYGWAHPYGHIFLNENLLKNSKDAVATALHEFGHQVEFQLFEQAPKEVKQAINEAWAASKKEGAGKTVEQLRPITSEKYGPEHAGLIPTTPKDKGYYLGFNEWFAEQASRWLTTAKEPVTIADKFFKGIADAWKAIYAKVTGHLPMAKATEDFMKMNWEGKLINETTTKNIFEIPEGTTIIPTEAPKAPVLTEPVIATVDGESLRRMRSYIATRAAEHPDGNIRYQARQLLKQIDGAIEKSNPKVAKQLQDTNKKYRATLALKELRMMNDPSIEAGKISPVALGKLLEREGSDLSHPLSKYGEFGTALKMRSDTEGAEYVSDPIRSLLSLGERKTKALLSPLSYPLGRTRRAIQRQMAPGEAPPFVAGSKTAGAITAAELQQLIEEQQKKGR